MIKNILQIATDIESSDWLQKYKEFGKKLLRQLARENISDFASFERAVNRILAAFNEHLEEETRLTGVERQEPIIDTSGLGALTPLGKCQRENGRLQHRLDRILEANRSLHEEIETLGKRLASSEATYVAYIDGLQKEINDLKAGRASKQGPRIATRAELDEIKARMEKANYYGDLPLPDLSAEKAAYENRHWSDCAVNNAPAMVPGPCNCGGYPSKGSLVGAKEKRDLVRFTDGSFLEVTYFEARHIETASGREIEYRQSNGKNLGINVSSIRYIEEL